MPSRIIDTPVRIASMQHDRMTITLSDATNPEKSELVIDVAFRGVLDPSLPAVINQAIVLGLVRNAVIAQIQAIARDHGPIPEEPQ